MASLILPVQTAVRITLAREQGTESWTVDRITQVARDVLGDDNRFYAHATSLLPGGVQDPSVYENCRERRGYQGSSRGTSSGRSGQHGFKRSENNHDVSKKFHCEQHGPNDSHGSKDCQFLKFKRARAEGKCVKCGKPYERGLAEVCGQRRPPGVGPSPTALNPQVFAASVVPAAAMKSSPEENKAEEAESVVDQDQLMSELAFQYVLIYMS
ncbi:hypothetical protein PS15p_208794 [Mucor circinelloides]